MAKSRAYESKYSDDKVKPDIDAKSLKNSIYAPIKRKLFRDLFLLIFFSLTVLLSFAYFFSVYMQKQMAITILDNSSEQVKLQFKNSFTPLQKSIPQLKNWLHTNNINSSEIEKLNQRLIPLLEANNLIASIIIADSDNHQYFLTRGNKQWLVREFINKKDSKNNDSEKQAIKWSIFNLNGQLISSYEEQIDYKMDQRPWYSGARELQNKSDNFISSPYLFFNDQILGITISSQYTLSKKSNKTFILAFDIRLNDINQSLSEIKVGENGKVFLLTHDGTLLITEKDLSQYRGTNNGEQFLKISGKNNQHIIFDSIAHWKKSKQTSHPISFKINNQGWWSTFFTLIPGNNMLQAGIIVPEHDFLRTIERKMLIFIPLLILIILFSIIAAWVVVKNNSRRQKQSPKTEFVSENFEAELYELLRMGESEILELKSTMRKNLKSGKNGKEIEIAWLKGVVAFLNTSGGILLIGVDDDAVILGIEADEFENDDKVQLHFKNLLNQHIGLEFSKYINFFLRTIDKKQIIIIECQKSQQPAFLYNKNNETFYIRSGPASVSLSISKALKYIQSHNF